jgi:plastocyanin
MPQVRSTASGRRHRPAALAALALVVLATVVACSTSDTGGEPVATTEVQLPKSYRFEPAAITVPVGATVTWTNDDNFTHNVTFEDSEPLAMFPRHVGHADVRHGRHLCLPVHAPSPGHAGNDRGQRILIHSCRRLSGTAG